MDPITATGLISLGKNLLENTLLKPNGVEQPPDGKAFSNMLEQAGGTSETSGIAAILSQYGVHSLEDLRKLHLDLKRQLLDSPDLAVAQAGNNGGSIHLIKSADGTFEASLSNGKTVDFPPNSQVAETAEAFHHLSTFLGEGIAKDRPGSIILNS
tara:strand:- start:248 stop:712 length:465 start_codon:yes stop_codon:yes gene_type:complete